MIDANVIFVNIVEWYK